MGLVMIILAMVFVLGPIAKAYAERISSGLPPDSEADRLELARVRDEVDRLSTEVARLRDEQSFMLKLLNEGDRAKLLKDPDGPSHRGSGARPHPGTTGEPNGD